MAFAPRSRAYMNRLVYFALGAFATAVAVTQVIKLVRRAQPWGADARSRYHTRLAPLADALRGERFADYLGDAPPAEDGLPSDFSTGLLFAQHHALPTILQRDSGARCVVVNFHGPDAAARAQALGLAVRNDLGAGLYVMVR